MKFEELKVGQKVLHTNGFFGEVVKLTNHHSEDVHIKITDKGTSNMRVGDKYVALPLYLTLVEDVKKKQVLEVEIKTNIEEVTKQATNMHEVLVDVSNELTEIRLEAEALVDIRKDESIFEADLGNGIKFKGTKSDYAEFLEGIAFLTHIGNQTNTKF